MFITRVSNSFKATICLIALTFYFYPMFAETVNAENDIVETFTTKPPERLTEESAEDIKIKKTTIARKLNIDAPVNSFEMISLPGLDYEKIIKEDNQNLNNQKELRVSIHRPIDQSFDPKWRTFQGSDGRYSQRIVIHSSGAGFIRPHFKKFPSADSELYLYGKDGIDSLEGPVKKPAVYESDEFWGPVINGDYLYIEVVQSSVAEIPDLYVDTISHGYRDPISGAVIDYFLSEKNLLIKVGRCELDISCYPEWVTYGTGVAMIEFEKDGAGYLCTGSLIMDQNKTFRNWFLTANHCISDNTVANTLITYFNYRTNNCNGPSPAPTPSVYGATFKVGTSESDFSLLELAGNPPSGVSYLGWTIADLSNWAQIAGIHHPDGSFQRISFGNGDRYPYDFNIDGIPYQGINFWDVLWTSGATEPGSSGSPIFNSDEQIVGQLLGGISDCTIHGPDVYGKFSVSWNAGLKDYLAASPSPVYRFSSDHEHFYTISEDEKNYVLQNYPQYHLEGAGFYAYQSQQSGTSPVYRFSNTLEHFYTIYEDEKNNIMQNLPDYHYENMAFYAFQTQQQGTFPVYRFTDALAGVHFYTIYEEEKNYVLQNLPNYHYEGIAFYAYQTQ